MGGGLRERLNAGGSGAGRRRVGNVLHVAGSGLPVRGGCEGSGRSAWSWRCCLEEPGAGRVGEIGEADGGRVGIEEVGGEELA